ncbi:hypothetical protein [Streptomyces sp. NPDC051576]|uniref:hypothetical protein n=1 Tax=Streptomyces sp. NPDC051576 TaxID=3155803 RepID=UPI003433B37A
MNNTMGESIDEPSESRMREILAELHGADVEHGDVSLIHESGWSLSVYPDKALLWENVNDSEIPPREFTAASWQEVIDALIKLSRGDIAAVNSLNWDAT